MKSRNNEETKDKMFKEIRGTENKFLNWVGNICGKISHMFMGPQLKWGTMFKWDMIEDIDKPEYTQDEIW